MGTIFKNVERDFEGIKGAQIVVGVFSFVMGMVLYGSTKLFTMGALGNGMFLFGSACFMFLTFAIFLEQLYL
tara:strand:+ start:27490 stop:27705 length:216 start_codon:yes stop_codon:yes gene_type:complete